MAKCYSEKGGGGGIFIVNEKIDSLPITLSNIKFTSCSAEYGGAIYIYSISVLINSCQFTRNTATSTNERNQFYGGSAVYLTIKNGDFNNCLFSNNKGKSQIKVNRNYNAKPSLQSTGKHSISISKCTFEIDQNSQSSLFVVHNNKNDVVNVLNCVFVGNLTNDSYHIDGKSLSNEKPNIHINSCKFSSDSKKAINSRFMKIDSKNQIFKFDPNNSKLSLKFWISTATFLVAAVAVAAAFIVKRHQTEKIDQSLESHEILTKSIEDTHDI